MAGGNAVKIGIIVAALGVAVVVFVMTGKEPESRRPPGASETRDCLCTQCGHRWEMAEAEWHAAIQAAPAAPPPPEGPRTRNSPRPIKMVQCPQCNEFAGVLAAKCPDSDTWYPIRNPDGTRGSCPD
ncbi:MAG: hypothetical protein ABII12_12920 [Planctomycetota bacterium]